MPAQRSITAENIVRTGFTFFGERVLSSPLVVAKGLKEGMDGIASRLLLHQGNPLTRIDQPRRTRPA
jgi:hypothetical protein